MKSLFRRLANGYAGITPRGRASILLGGVLLAGLVAACSDSGSKGGPSSGDEASKNAVSTNDPGVAAASALPRGRQQLRGHLDERITYAPIAEAMAPKETLTLTLGLDVADPAALRDAVAGVSDPASPSYRKYMTPEEFGAKFGASASSYDTLVAWAKSRNLTVIANPNRLTVQVSGAVSDIELAFYVHMHYRLRKDGSPPSPTPAARIRTG